MAAMFNLRVRVGIIVFSSPLMGTKIVMKCFSDCLFANISYCVPYKAHVVDV